MTWTTCLGVIYVNDLFRSSTLKRAIGVSLPTTEEITRKIRRPFMLPETFDLLESLSEMRKQHRTFALIIDEHGGVAGVASIRDILEQLVGDLNDEFDEDDEVDDRQDPRRSLAGRWSDARGPGRRRDWPRRARRRVRHDRWIRPGFGRRDPRSGHDLHVRDWTFRVQSVEKRRISELVIEHHPPREPDSWEIVPSDTDPAHAWRPEEAR